MLLSPMPERSCGFSFDHVVRDTRCPGHHLSVSSVVRLRQGRDRGSEPQGTADVGIVSAAAAPHVQLLTRSPKLTRTTVRSPKSLMAQSPAAGLFEIAAATAFLPGSDQPRAQTPPFPRPGGRPRVPSRAARMACRCQLTMSVS